MAMTDLGGKLPRRIFEILQKAGIKTPEQVVSTSDNELLRLCNLSLIDIKKTKDVASRLLFPEGFTNAHEVKKMQLSLGKLSTGCHVLDGYLKGGLRPRTLVEIFGESGCGKTQIALQVAANCWKSGAVYVCTEDSFPSKRLQQIFKGLNEKNKGTQDLSKYGDNIFILHVTEVDDLQQCLNVKLPHLLMTVKTISLIVLDSIAAPFRGEFQCDLKGRAQHLKDIGFTLLSHAKKYNLTVLCINQVSANIDAKDSSDVLPCLGLTWSNMVTTRIRLHKTDRFCHIDHVVEKAVAQCDVSGSCGGLIQRQTGISMTETSMLQIRELKIEWSPELPLDIPIEYVITANGVVGLN